ncbi:Rap1a/Tai family immunity protein [Pseudoduganella lurida]|uniref:Rap1a/Tai family immunity protein n=1 Tax=Pseudoduganella lurida TaxID=1036180 RepID=UPI00119EC040|nr:Rap1a/Tai family immunity protein [Pseudoduganella lurida]
MKLKTDFFLVTFAFLMPWQAGAAQRFYDLSGDLYVQFLSRPEPLGEADYRNRDRAYSYLDGVKDVSIGTGWCPARPRKTFELAYDAADYIRKLPADARHGNAAPLLLAFLNSRYPCPKGVDR